MFFNREKLSPAKLAEKQLKSIKIRKNEIAIDCGANVGKYTRYLAKNNGTVYAFEPNPYAFGALYSKFRKQSNVKCINKGVMDEPGRMKLYLRKDSKDNPVYWSTSSSFMTYSQNLDYDSHLEIEVVDLSNFIESLNSKIKLIKMDIEGAEVKILKKMIDTGIIDKVQHMFVEMHDDTLNDLKEEATELRDIIRTKGLNNINLDWK